MDPELVIKGLQWYETQAGVAAMTLGAVSIGLSLAIWKLFTWFTARLNDMRLDTKQAFAQHAELWKEQHSDSQIFAAALSANTVALARVSERVEISDRRGNR